LQQLVRTLVDNDIIDTEFPIIFLDTLAAIPEGSLRAGVDVQEWRWDLGCYAATVLEEVEGGKLCTRR
jgi:hypothetical protein